MVSGYTGRRPLLLTRTPKGFLFAFAVQARPPAPPGCVCPGSAQPAPVRSSVGIGRASRAAPRCPARTSCVGGTLRPPGARHFPTPCRPSRVARLFLSVFLPVFPLVQARPPARPPPTIGSNPPQVWGRPSVRGLHRWTTTRRGRAKKDMPAGGAGCPLRVCVVRPLGERTALGIYP